MANKNSAHINGFPGSSRVEVDVDVVRDAVQTLRKVHESLKLEVFLDPAARRRANVFWTVGTDALVKAADLATELDIKEFDAQAAMAAADFERTYTPLLREAKILVSQIEDEMTSRHAGPAKAVWALFSALKALARIRQDHRLRAGVEELSAFLVHNNGSTKEPAPVAPDVAAGTEANGG